MMRLAWAQFRHAPARLLSVLLAVMLSASTLAGTVVFSATSTASMRATTAAPLEPVDVVIDPGDANLANLPPTWAEDVLDKADVDSEVKSTAPYLAATYTAYGSKARGVATITSIADSASLRWFSLEQGDWPKGDNQIVISQDTADQLGVGVGDTITLKTDDGAQRKVTVSGINDVKFKPFTGTDYAMYAAPIFFAGVTPTELFVKLADPSETDGITAKIADAAKSAGVAAYTGEELARQSASRLAGGSTQLTVIMAAFALIALFAAMMVISSTYKTLIAQRTHDIAMLRLIGARRANVRSAVLCEALIVGLIGTIAGGAIGLGGGYAAMVATGQAFGGFAANPALLAGALLLTVAATVAAAWMTVRHATRIPPVQALQGAAAGETSLGAPASQRRMILILVIGAACAALGAALLSLGATMNQMPVALIGGLALAAGLLLALPRLTTLVMPVIARMLSACGLSGRLAASSMAANPQRAGATITAMAFGISLIAALSSAATTGTATIAADNDERYPITAALYTPDGSPLSGKILDHRSRIDDAKASYPVRTAAIDQAPDGGKTTPVVLEVVPDKAMTTFGQIDLKAGSGSSSEPMALAHPRYMSTIGIGEGDGIDLTVAGTQLSLRVRPSQLAESPRLAIVITDSTLDALPEATRAGIERALSTSMIWFKSADGIDRGQLAKQVNQLAVADPNATVGGGIAESNDIMSVLDMLLMLSYAMLAITVIISLTGLANQLALSVAERRAEISMLRALGARRGVVRLSIAWEALVLTIIGTLVGLAVGMPLGIAGVKAQVGGMTDRFTIAMPWMQIGVLVPVILAAALLASAIPARHATAIAPAEGLTS